MYYVFLSPLPNLEQNTRIHCAHGIRKALATRTKMFPRQEPWVLFELPPGFKAQAWV